MKDDAKLSKQERQARVDAIDAYEHLLNWAEKSNDKWVQLPTDAARLLLDLAKRGIGRGTQGGQPPKGSHAKVEEKLRKYWIIRRARDMRDELIAGGTPRKVATLEVAAKLATELKCKVSTAVDELLRHPKMPRRRPYQQRKTG